jgi:CheY-like chemotaxis protein
MSASQILVVEDEAIVATGIKNELEHFGYAVPAIDSSAAEAVEKAVKEKPDLEQAQKMAAVRRLVGGIAHQPTILLADSDSMVRDFGRRILEEQGYQVLVAEDGVQAVEVFRQAPVQIDLAIIDLNIPRLTGDAVLERLLELDPNAEVLFSSAYFAEDRPQTLGENHLLGVISKPYLREELVRMVQRALARRFELDH